MASGKGINFGRLTSSLRSLGHRLAGKKQVGTDLAGNTYFIDPSSPNRRWVEYRNEDLLGDTSTVPMTWHRWLRHGRGDPPTLAELESEQAAKVALAQRVAQITAADQKLRMQEIAEKHLNDGSPGSSYQNMERERDQHGGISRWGQTGSGVAGGRSQA